MLRIQVAAAPEVVVNRPLALASPFAIVNPSRLAARSGLPLVGLCAMLTCAPAFGQLIPRSVEAGLPRAWEAGLQVSPFTTVNLYNGNATTVIPIVAWDPVGPPLVFNLYHNSASANSSGPPAPWGFELGGGWTISYGAMIDYDGTIATLIEEDGNEWEYEENSGDFTPPAGKFDHLVYDGEETWELTRLNQWKWTFEWYDADNGHDFYRLTQIADNAGNTLTVVYHDDEAANDRIDYINTAVEDIDGNGSNRLTFNYDADGTPEDLDSVTDPIGRTFEFTYTDDMLTAVEDGKGQVTQITGYNGTNRITSITDRADKVWGISYTNGRLTRAVDLDQDSDGTMDAGDIWQEFSYPTGTYEGLYKTVYTDRRDNDWDYRFSTTTGDCRKVRNPNGDWREWTYDGEHNRLTFVDELLNTWTATYASDPPHYSPYLATLTGPAVGDPPDEQVWALDWERPDATNRPNFWRLTQVEDPAGHTVEYVYNFHADEDGTVDDLTLVTGIVEMDPDGTGSAAESTTTLDYYWSDDPNAKGQLKTVKDDNEVEHHFKYDDLGYQTQMWEGTPLDIPGPDIFRVRMDYCVDAAGRRNYECQQTSVGCLDTIYCSGVEFDENNNLINAICPSVYRDVGDGIPIRLGHPPAAWIAPLETCSTGNEYDALDRPTGLNGCYDDPDVTADSGSRTADMTYDALSRLLTLSVASTEHRGSGLLELTQTWDYDDWQSAGEVSVTAGPDGQESTYTFAVDDLGRPASVAGGGMSMTYAYDVASRVDYVEYGNGTQVDYDYDDANRVTQIRHLGLAPSLPVLYQTDYEWNPNNTIATRTETDNSSGSTVETLVTFGYDDRDRLIRETRVRQGDPDVTEYTIEYLYDDLGNRLQKSQTTATEGDAVTVVTDYVYDITEPNQEFVTKNNRLMYYTETVDSELRRTVYYTYYETGDVSNITIKDETSPNTRSDLALTYARNGGLWLAVWGDYNVDATTQEYVEDSYAPSAAREFRYESGRGRYMSRDYDTNSSADPGDWTPLTAWTYTEYLGDTPIADWEIDLDGQTNEPVWTKLRTYLPGSSSGDAAGAQLNADDSIQYYHGDLVGSTIGTTDADGTNGVFDGPPITVAYTAFGELVANDGDDNVSIGFGAPAGFPRYQYCGAWGYESGAAGDSGAMLSLSGHDETLPPIGLMHVGARWYDPALGRFVQRDPMGLQAGRNLYTYCGMLPTALTDADGLLPLPIWVFVQPFPSVDTGDLNWSMWHLYPPGSDTLVAGLLSRRVGKDSLLVTKAGGKVTKNAVGAWLIRHGAYTVGHSVRWGAKYVFWWAGVALDTVFIQGCRPARDYDMLE